MAVLLKQQAITSILYRSAPQIVQLSNAIFPDSPPLQAHRDTTGHTRATEVLNEYSEAHWVLSRIQNAIGGSDLIQGLNPPSQYQQLHL